MNTLRIIANWFRDLVTFPAHARGAWQAELDRRDEDDMDRYERTGTL